MEIFTDKDGELIFKKYSPIGELGDFAGQICDALRRASEGIAAVCDRDTVIAVAGGGKKELLGRPISAQLSNIMEARSPYRCGWTVNLPVSPDDEGFGLTAAAPILTEGDVMGCVLFLAPQGSTAGSEVEYKLAQTAALFLGKQLES